MHNLYTFARLQRAIADGALQGEAAWTSGLRAELGRTIDGYREGFQRHPVRRYLG